MRIDHVLWGVRDLDAAAARLFSEYGLAVSGGGEHPGLGTANRIVPLGEEYIELIAVVDPGSPNSFAAALTEQIVDGDALVGVSLEVDDIDLVADRIGSGVLAAERATPDGPPLRFRITGMEFAVAERLPFFIQWDEGRERRLGGTPAQHRGVTPMGLAWVELGVEPERAADYLGVPVPGLRLVEGTRGVRAVGIEVADGSEIVIGR